MKDRGETIFITAALVLVAGVPLALYSVYYFANSVQLLASAVLVFLLLITVAGLLIVKKWDQIIARIFSKPAEFSRDISTFLAKTFTAYSRGDIDDAEEQLQLSVKQVVAHVSWVQARRWILGSSAALLLGFAGLVGSALLKQQNDLILQQNEFFREQIDQQQQQLDLQQSVSNQTIRSESFRRIYGSEFGGNPRVKAEAVRSLISVERARIATGENSLPTDFINLHDAELRSTWLDSADLRKSSFRGSDIQRANFNSANLSGSQLRFTELQRATFVSATLREVVVAFSNGQQSVFASADLTNAFFSNVDLFGADLGGANLNGASFHGCNLQGADLSNIQNWQSIENITGTNIYGVRNSPDGFQAWAIENGAIDEAGALSDLWEQSLAFRNIEESAQ